MTRETRIAESYFGRQDYAEEQVTDTLIDRMEAEDLDYDDADDWAKITPEMWADVEADATNDLAIQLRERLDDDKPYHEAGDLWSELLKPTIKAMADRIDFDAIANRLVKAEIEQIKQPVPA